MSVSLITVLQNTGFLDTDHSTAVVSSFGPQRSKGGATRRRKGTGMQKDAPKGTLLPDVNWTRTYDRFYWKMIEVYLLRLSGGLPTPEEAYAGINEFIKEDLSPISG